MVQKVIISRKRSASITSHLLFPTATLVVPECERDAYKAVVPNKIVTIPDDVYGLGRVRNKVQELFGYPVVICDDDITAFVGVCSYTVKQIDFTQIEYAIENIIEAGLALGTSLVGFSQKQYDVRKYRFDSPFNLKTWVGCVIGILKPIKFIENKFKVDVDATLQTLLKDRILFVDERFSFIQARDKNVGGASEFRTEELYNFEMQVLKEKWGKHIHFSNTRTNISTRLSVER